jgi:precorrin-4 C11-methyltransferase
MSNAIITYSDAGYQLAHHLISLGFSGHIVIKDDHTTIASLFKQHKALIFIGALGICVRQIAPFIRHKSVDPAVINIDVNGEFVQSVIGGHGAGANELAQHVALLLGATPIITTVSDTTGLWSLDVLPRRFNWKMETAGNLTSLMAAFVNGEPTALLLEARDKGTQHLEMTLPRHVSVFYKATDINTSDFSLILAVTPFIHYFGKQCIYFRPAMLHLGVGCQKDVNVVHLTHSIINRIKELKISPLAIKTIGTGNIKKDEPALHQLADNLNVPLITINESTLNQYAVPSPSNKVTEVTGSSSIAEASAMHLANNQLLVTKQKLLIDDKYATLAIAIDQKHQRKGMVEIVGAGPGDPQLVTVRGKLLLQTADLILYAGSLVPVELTHYAKPGCVVRNSASMNLQEQIALMKEFTDRQLLVVRLHTGDPCIYGAIQEQMAEMDQLSIHYRITPGVSSFQAAAAALQSQFTIPEEVQTIILTRGEGRTPMPDREQLHKLAQSQSTMCIFLSATLAAQVQQQLLMHYPPETPVAICHKLTWKDEKIWRCQLSELEQSIKDNNLTTTTLIVVGKAIDNRQGLSKLYHNDFKHLFRS